MFIPDTSIKTEKQDCLGITKFSHAIAENILNWKGEDSIVIGLYGKWGSGKTSVLNLVDEYIKQKKKKEKLVVLKFNPWNFNDQNRLLFEFFNQIGIALSEKEYFKDSKKIGKELISYSKLFTPLSFIPGVEPWASIVKKVMESLGTASKEFGELQEKDLTKTKDKINKLLKKSSQHFLVIIDDIDRLNPKEIKQIFQLIKLNADFPKTIYLTAFEREVVEKSLEDKGISGKEYLEKIVQVGFDVPLVQESKLTKFFAEHLYSILERLPNRTEKYWDQTRFGNLYHAGFQSLFHTIRNVKRYINSLEFNLSLLCKEGSIEVNPIDFIGIEAIRVFAPEFYHLLKNKNSLFTSFGSESLGGQDNTEKRKEEIEGLLGQIKDANIQKAVRGIMAQLFPSIEHMLTGRGFSGGYSLDYGQIWEKELRICAESVFDRYFVFDIPDGDIAQFEIDKLLSLTNDLMEFEKGLRSFLEAGRIQKLLETLETHLDDFPLNDAKSIVTGLFNISDDLPSERRGFYDFGCGVDLSRIIHFYLMRTQDKKKNKEILAHSIMNSKGLYGPIDRISLESRRKDKEKTDDMLIEEGDLGEFQELCVKKIESFWEKDKLKNVSHIQWILHCWKKWDDNVDVGKIVKELTDTNEGLVNFIAKSLSESFSYGGGDYVSRRKYRIDYKGLAGFLDLDLVKDRLEKLTLEKLNKKEKLAREVFLKDFDNKDNNRY